MGVIKIKGKWAIDYYAQGKRYREVVGDGKSRTLAQSALHSVMTKIAEEKYLPDKKDMQITVGEILDKYWNDYLRHKPEAFRSRCYYDALKDEFGHLPLVHLTKAMVLEFQRSKTNQRKTDGNFLKPSTVNKVVTFLATAINFAIKMERVKTRNPCNGIGKLPENNARDVIMTETQFQELLRHLPPHLKQIVTFAYYTGCRRGEVLNLKRRDIRLAENVIHVRETKNGEDRFVPIAQPLKEMLLPLISQKGDDDFVFTYRGKSMGDIHKGFRRACKKAGLEFLRFHDLRHTCLTNWHNAGHSHFLIMQASGHKTISCFQRYLSFRNNDLQKLVFVPDGHLMDTQEKVNLSKAV